MLNLGESPKAPSLWAVHWSLGRTLCVGVHSRKLFLFLQLSWLSILLWGLPWWLSGKEPPVCLQMQETQVQPLGQEDALEKEVATHSSILAWETMDRGACWAIVHGVLKS